MWLRSLRNPKGKIDLKKILIYSAPIAVLAFLLIIFGLVGVAENSQAQSTDSCVECHKGEGVLTGIISDWEQSKHAVNNVTCIDCHLAEEEDSDGIRHHGYTITHVVSPKDCSNCHENEVEEFDRSLHSFGSIYYEFLYNKGVLPYLESQLEGGFIVSSGIEITDAATLRGCQACHGTNMTGKNIDDYTVWPNNGIGRINPDGSKGSCSACHSRHSFSAAEARHPETCGQCHMGPDHPHIEIYMESKHGNIYAAEGDSWSWDDDNWTAGVDYLAPTCASCHMSAAPGLPVTHDVSSRLSWELESAISKHTDNTANSLGVPLSDGTSWETKRDRMQAVCQQCHSGTWVENFYKQADIVVELYNEQYSEAKATVDELYAEGLLTPEPFDEPVEFKIYEMWHHEGRRARMGAFMAGPDYVQWHGFYDLLQDRVEIEHTAETLRAEAAEQNGHGTGDDDDDDENEGWTFDISWLWCGTLIIILAVILSWLFFKITEKQKLEHQKGLKHIKSGLDEMDKR